MAAGGLSNPFGEEESEWLASTLSSTLQHFGEKVDTRFKVHEREITDSKARISALEGTVKTLTEQLQTAGVVQQSEEFVALQAAVVVANSTIGEIEKKMALSLLTPSEGGGSSSSQPKADVPSEHRTVFKMGNLGWDETEAVIEKRAKEVLGLLGLAENQYIGPVACRRKGSLADVQFFDASIGCLSRLRCKQLKKSFGNTEAGHARIVWFDAAKTMNELQPGRTTRRARDVLQIFEDGKIDKVPLTCNLRDMTVSRSDVVQVSFRIDPPAFTPSGVLRYSDDERKRCGAIH